MALQASTDFLLYKGLWRDYKSGMMSAAPVLRIFGRAPLPVPGVHDFSKFTSLRVRAAASPAVPR
ncbi:hypothetical protein KL86DES1_20140 [uncultured Desulfovibrio sp.]|uniref:Uncharacterized protein n=1 Tax=uncultured Desulfovibrio sp. TaxID=167968 RepID=A0A212L2W7_9BACT|nr:hypothetical protein KL86DES1_20140 [uncultured Desulfovibrio sp.]VZH33039.1 conserved protein of unknown function [Desulfovibrio sp. 86]